MGITAENLAEQYGISREEQDEFAASSQQKAERAVAEGIFRDEIVPIEVPVKGGTRQVENDEQPRPGTTADALAKLRAAFGRDGGTVTAGNASGINDGAAAIVVMSASRANERGLRMFGTVESYASVGVEPKIMGIGPVPAVRKALAKAGLELGDIDLFELNEAFAAQSLAVLRELDIDHERINPHGGAIALGHPIGASGGRILVTLLHEMRRRNAGRGLASPLRRGRSGAGCGHPQRRQPVERRGHEPRTGRRERSPTPRAENLRRRPIRPVGARTRSSRLRVRTRVAARRGGPLPKRQEIKRIALADPPDLDQPFATWSLSKPGSTV